MNSKENLYIKDDKAQGFIKPYKSVNIALWQFYLMRM